MNRYLAARSRTIGLSARSLHMRILDQQDTHITSMKNEKYKLFKVKLQCPHAKCLSLYSTATSIFQAVRDSARTRKKTGLRFFEGYRLVKDALANGFTPEEVFMSADMIKSQHGKIIADLLLDLERGGKGAVRPYCVDDILLNTLSETVQPQSVFALFKAPAVETDEAIEYFLRQQAKKRLMSPSCVHSAMILLCDGVSDPGNIGTLVRSSVGFGADALIVVGGCDPWVMFVCSV